METAIRTTELETLVTALEEQHTRKLDVVVPGNELRVEGGRLIRSTGFGDIRMDRNIWEFTNNAVQGLAIRSPFGDTETGVIKPAAKYLRELLAHEQDGTTDLFDAVLNAHLAANPSKLFMVRSFLNEIDGSEGTVRAVMSNSYRRMDNLDMLTAMMKGIQASGHDVVLGRCDLSDARMRITFRVPGMTFTANDLLDGYVSPYPVDGVIGVKGNDLPVVEAGIVGSNSETGQGGYTVAPYARVKICDNGMHMNVTPYGKKLVLKQTHLGPRVGQGVMMASDTLAAVAESYVLQTRDAVSTFLDRSFFEKELEVITTSAVRPLVANPSEVMDKLSKELAWTREQRSAVFEDFMRSGVSDRAAGVMHAITSASQREVFGPDTAQEMDASVMRAMDIAVAVRPQPVAVA